MNIRFLTLTALCWLPGALAHAEVTRLTVPSFKSLQSKATDSVNIDINPWLLRIVGAALNDDDEDDAAFKTLLTGLESVQVRNFEFASDFAYPTAEIDTMRRQLATPGWTRIVEVHDRKDAAQVDIYIATGHGQTQGFALIASDPRRLTVINVVGSIRPEDLPALQRHLHMQAVPLPAVAMR